MRFLDNVSAGVRVLLFCANHLFVAASDWLVQKMTGVAVMAVTERLRGN
jgi:hypothetical protein